MWTSLPKLLFNDTDLRRVRDYSVDVIRVEQQTAYYCGAACSVMILKYFNKDINQPTAYSEIHDKTRFSEEKLYSDPEGIQAFLNKHLYELDISAVAIPSDTFEEAIEAVFQSLAFYDFPCVVLVQNGNHWITVDAARVFEGPDGQLDVVGLIVENPWYNKTPQAYVAIEEFRNRWLSPNQWGKTWINKYVIVGRKENKQSRKLSLLHLRPALNFIMKDLSINRSREDLEKIAIGNMAKHGFHGVKPISGGGAAVLTPLKVLDESEGKYYWIVPVDATSENIFRDFTYVAIDHTGKLLEVTRISAELDILNDIEIDILLQRTFSDARITVDPEYRLIPGYETLSRFDVARRATIDDKAIVILRGGQVVNSITAYPVFGG